MCVENIESRKNSYCLLQQKRSLSSLIWLCVTQAINILVRNLSLLKSPDRYIGSSGESVHMLYVSGTTEDKMIGSQHRLNDTSLSKL